MVEGQINGGTFNIQHRIKGEPASAAKWLLVECCWLRDRLVESRWTKDENEDEDDQGLAGAGIIVIQ
jgi:hypothetical protein